MARKTKSMPHRREIERWHCTGKIARPKHACKSKHTFVKVPEDPLDAGLEKKKPIDKLKSDILEMYKQKTASKIKAAQKLAVSKGRGRKRQRTPTRMKTMHQSTRTRKAMNRTPM